MFFFSAYVLLFAFLFIAASAADYGFSLRIDGDKEKSLATSNPDHYYYETPKPQGKPEMPIRSTPDHYKPKMPKEQENNNPIPCPPDYENPKSPKEIGKTITIPSTPAKPNVPEKPSIPSTPAYEKPKKVPVKTVNPIPPTLSYQSTKQGGKDKLSIPSIPLDKDDLLPTTVGIQGLVLCKSGSKYFPLQGAVTKLTCQVVDENGNKKAPFSTLSHPADRKEYFLTTLSVSELNKGGSKYKLSECKAFLDASPLETRKVPTDVNKGITGALLSSFRVLHDKKIKLYSVGPFFYCSEEPNHSVSKGSGY